MGSIYNVLALPFFLVRNFFNTKFYWWKVHGHLNLLGKLAYRVSDAVYTATESTFPHTGRKKRVVGHAVLLPTPIKPKEAFATPLRLLSVGRVMPSKHLEVSIHVIRLLRDAGIEAHLSIVGPYSDPVYYAELTALIEKYDLQEQVVFLGPKTHDALPSFYGESDILIHPSTTGGIDKVVLEAMVYGVIPVCLHTPYKSILDPSLCVEENTPALYVDCITALRNREKASIIELRRTLEDEVREHHSLDTLTSRIFGTIGT
jgi:glycosyltransferase involved in cell wall biosynthesis